MDTVKIIGIKSAPSSKNPEVMYYNYYFTQDFSEYDLQNASMISGVACDSEFCMADIGCQVGDVVEFHYKKGFQGKAALVGCSIVKEVNKSMNASDTSNPNKK